MVNLHYDISALVIYLVILFSMILRRVIKGYTNRTFFIVLLISTITTAADIISECHIFTPFVRWIFDYVYFTGALLVPLFYTFYIYTSIGLYQYLISNTKIWIILAIPLFVFLTVIIANIFSDCAFIVDEEGNYIRGPLQPVLIACILVYILTGLGIILRWHKIVSKSKLFSLCTFFPIMALSLLIQQKYQGLELTMFGLAISELIISFTVQRFDENYDRITGTKNHNSAVEDFKKVFITHQNIAVIYIRVKNQKGLKHILSSTDYNKFMRIFCDEVQASVKHFESLIEMYFVHEEIYAVKVMTDHIDVIRAIAELINRRVNKPFQLNDVSVSLDSTVCIVRIPKDIDNIESLMNFRLNFYTKLPETGVVHELSNYLESKEFKIKNELDLIVQRAIADQNFKMYYQPIYSTKLKKFISAEALIRLNDPKYGFISPALFIPEAENSGAIHQIGDFVIESVCRFASNHPFEKLGLEYIELNLSVAQCIEGDLVQKIDRITSDYNISPDQLNLEITETAEGFDPEVMDSNIRVLNQKGYKFSLDDYGTGYSNIKRVTSLPLEIVKLDKTFVDEMDNPMMWSVIVNTVKMFKEMKKIILVEGVETKEKLDALTALGCDYIQGFYFSKPLPEEEFVQFLQRENFKQSMIL